MKLFLIEQSQNDNYDTYDAAVVIAENEEEARNMDPSTGEQMEKEDWRREISNWCSSPNHVSVKFLGESVDSKKGIVCSSFHAGWACT
ncbi:MAG: hypothetical protein GY801_10815 [bacterium]|nr:hypothetical protein [bacterium]